MQNAHLRLGQLEYTRSSAGIQTHIRLHVDRFMGEDEQGHLLSVFGGDAEVGAITAAVQEQHSFSLTLPGDKKIALNMGPAAACYRGTLPVQGRKQPLRHLVAVSQALHANGSAGRTFMLNREPQLAWSTLVSFLGLPADPRWKNWGLNWLEQEGKITPLTGIGCDPVAIAVTRDELLASLADALREGRLCFPEETGPILWQSYRMQDALSGMPATS